MLQMGMLVLTRKPNQTIVIGKDITIKVVRVGSGQVRIGVVAPDHQRIVRGELLDEVKPEDDDDGATDQDGAGGSHPMDDPTGHAGGPGN
jgi:carbon storage regulator